MTQEQQPIKTNALEPGLSVVSQNDREIRRIRLVLLTVAVAGVISVLLTRMSGWWRMEFGIVPQLLTGFVILALVVFLHFASQRKLLSEVSTALVAATSYVDRLEQFSFIDPKTQLFNRKYLDQLFNQQSKWLNRTGESATLLLVDVLPDRQKLGAEEIVIETAFVLRSSFRGSDFVVRNSTNQFLVLLPDTTENQAQFALNRLADKVAYWNLQNETSEMALRHEFSTCPPGGNLWEKLREMEEMLRNKPDPATPTLVPHKLASDARLTFPGQVTSQCLGCKFAPSS